MERVSWSFVARPSPRDRALRAVNQSDFFHPASSHLNQIKLRRGATDSIHSHPPAHPESLDPGRSQLLGVDLGREPRLAAATGSSVALWRPVHADRGISGTHKVHMLMLALPDAPPKEDVPEWCTPRTAGTDLGSPGRVFTPGFQDCAAAHHLSAHMHQMSWQKYRTLRPRESRPATGGKGHFQYPGGTESMLAEKQSRLGFTVPVLDLCDRREGEYLVSKHSPTRHSFDATASQSFTNTRRPKTARMESLTNGPLWRSPGVDPMFEKTSNLVYAAYPGPWVPAAKRFCQKRPNNVSKRPNCVKRDLISYFDLRYRCLLPTTT
jgi:hypothetical protein